MSASKETSPEPQISPASRPSPEEGASGRPAEQATSSTPSATGSGTVATMATMASMGNLAGTIESTEKEGESPRATVPPPAVHHEPGMTGPSDLHEPSLPTSATMDHAPPSTQFVLLICAAAAIPLAIAFGIIGYALFVNAIHAGTTTGTESISTSVTPVADNATNNTNTSTIHRFAYEVTDLDDNTEAPDIDIVMPMMKDLSINEFDPQAADQTNRRESEDLLGASLSLPPVTTSRADSPTSGPRTNLSSASNRSINENNSNQTSSPIIDGTLENTKTTNVIQKARTDTREETPAYIHPSQL